MTLLCHSKKRGALPLGTAIMKIRGEYMLEFIGIVCAVGICIIVCNIYMADEAHISIKINGKDVFTYDREDTDEDEDETEE